MLPIGFKQSETMRGYLRFLDEPGKERAVRFDCTYEITDWNLFLKTGETRLTGKFTCEDFVSDALMSGKLVILPVRRKLLIYDFTFPGPDGRSLHFEGEKRVEFLRILKTMRILYSRLLDGQKVIATGVIRFEWRDFPKFMASVKPTRLRR